MSDVTSDAGSVVDANVWIARILRDDRFHDESRRWLDSWWRARNRIAVPLILLSELSGALARRTGHPDVGHSAVADLGNVPRLTLVDLDDPLARQAAHLAATLHLRGADAIYVALAARLGLPLVTWDTELLDRAAKVIAVRTPSDA